VDHSQQNSKNKAALPLSFFVSRIHHKDTYWHTCLLPTPTGRRHPARVPTDGAARLVLTPDGRAVLDALLGD
jgi:hypothetical protein